MGQELIASVESTGALVSIGKKGSSADTAKCIHIIFELPHAVLVTNGSRLASRQKRGLTFLFSLYLSGRASA